MGKERGPYVAMMQGKFALKLAAVREMVKFALKINGSTDHQQRIFSPQAAM